MSKTFKVDAWYAHHPIPKQTSLREHSSKRKVPLEDVPIHLQELVEAIDKSGWLHDQVIAEKQILWPKIVCAEKIDY